MRHFYLLMLSLCLAAVSVTGCGGGGGGGGDASEASLSYSGNSSPAEITDSNADALAGTALYGTTTSSFDLSASVNSGGQDKSSLNLVGFAKSMADVAQEIDSGDMASIPASKAIQTDEDRIEGSCDGFVAYSMTYDDVTGEFNGSMNFTDYDDCNGEVISGPTSISGSLDLDSAQPELENFVFSFSKLTVTTGPDSEVLSGTISIQSTGTYGFEVNCTMVYQVNSAAVCKLENLIVTFDETSGSAAVSISGRAYHPDHGYVDITTTTPLEIYYYNDYPHAGVIEMRGANGTAGGTTMGTVTFAGTNSYSIDVDSDGDGAVDSGVTCSWNPDVCTENPGSGIGAFD